MPSLVEKWRFEIQIYKMTWNLLRPEPRIIGGYLDVLLDKLGFQPSTFEDVLHVLFIMNEALKK